MTAAEAYEELYAYRWRKELGLLNSKVVMNRPQKSDRDMAIVLASFLGSDPVSADTISEISSVKPHRVRRILNGLWKEGKVIRSGSRGNRSGYLWAVAS